MSEAVASNLKGIASFVHERFRLGKDCMIIVSGMEGEGKTAFACAGLAPAIDPNFSLEKNVVYTGSLKEYEDRYNELEKNSVIVIDESVLALHKSDHPRKDTKFLIKLFTALSRKEKQSCWILLIPRISELHKYIRDERSVLWLHLLPREELMNPETTATIMLYKKMDTPFGSRKSDSWLLDDHAKLWLSACKRAQGHYNERMVNILRKHPFYVGEMNFKKPCDRFFTKYEELRKTAFETYKIEDIIETKATYYKDRLYLFIHYLHKQGLKGREIASIGNLSEMSVSRIIRKNNE